MKTDKEIKEFIDSREVLTQNELSHFMYGHSCPVITYAKNGKEYQNKIMGWWGYVLKTKDWGKLRKYKKSHTIGFGRYSHFHKDKKIIEKIVKKYFGNKRLTLSDVRELLKEKYNIAVSAHTLDNYRIRMGIESNIEANYRKLLLLEKDPDLNCLSVLKASKEFERKYKEKLSKYVIKNYRASETKYKKIRYGGHELGGREKGWLERKNKVLRILKRDKRFFNMGCYKGNNLLFNAYGIKLHPVTLGKYKRESENKDAKIK